MFTASRNRYIRNVTSLVDTEKKGFKTSGQKTTLYDEFAWVQVRVIEKKRLFNLFVPTKDTFLSVKYSQDNRYKPTV